MVVVGLCRGIRSELCSLKHLTLRAVPLSREVSRIGYRRGGRRGEKWIKMQRSREEVGERRGRWEWELVNFTNHTVSGRFSRTGLFAFLCHLMCGFSFMLCKEEGIKKVNYLIRLNLLFNVVKQYKFVPSEFFKSFNLGSPAL